MRDQTLRRIRILKLRATRPLGLRLSEVSRVRLEMRPDTGIACFVPGEPGRGMVSFGSRAHNWAEGIVELTQADLFWAIQPGRIG